VSALFDRIALVGLGLLGGSLGLAARARGVARRVAGATRQPAARERALASGAVDELLPLDEVARGAELVVLARPTSAA
jgi:prephenate dehydrogenase